MCELGAGLAEILEPEPQAAVLLLKPTPLCPQQRARPLACRCPRREAHRPRDRQIGANAGQRLQHLGLRAVEPGRQSTDGNDEADADSETESGQDGAPAPSPQLADHVGDVEHALSVGRPEAVLSEPGPGESGLRPA